MNPTPDRIASLPCDVQLPDSWMVSPGAATGFVATQEESRRFHRWPFRCAAALTFRTSFPSMRRPAGWHRVYTLNLSRCGIAFLHSEPLFPTEKAHIIFCDGRELEIQVVRCRRIQERCHEIGARFVKAPGTLADPCQDRRPAR